MRIKFPSQSGFAIVAVMAAAALFSIAAIPLLGAVQTIRENSIQQRLTSLVTAEARENLEFGVILTKLAGGPPDYFLDINAVANRTHFDVLTPACQRRIDGALGAEAVAIDDTATGAVRFSPITPKDGRLSAVFVKTAATSGNNLSRYVLVSCALRPGEAVAVAMADLILTRGAFFTQSIREF